MPHSVTEPTVSIRVGRPILGTYLDGTQAWYDGDRSPEEFDRTAHALFHRIAAAPTRKDGSVAVRMTAQEREVLLSYAEAWEPGARDSVDRDDASTLADLNSIRSLIRQLYAAK